MEDVRFCRATGTFGDLTRAADISLKSDLQLTRNQPYVEARAYIEFATAFNKTKLSHFFSLEGIWTRANSDVSRLLPHAGFVDAVTSAHTSRKLQC